VVSSSEARGEQAYGNAADTSRNLLVLKLLRPEICGVKTIRHILLSASLLLAVSSTGRSSVVDNITTEMFKIAGGVLTETMGTFSVSGEYTPFTSPYPSYDTISPADLEAILDRVIIKEAYWNIYATLPGLPYKVEPGSYDVSGVPYRILVQAKKQQKIAYKLPRVFAVGQTVDPKAKADSGLAVVIVSTNKNVAVIRNGKIKVVGKGKTTLVFTQKGNNAWKRKVIRVPIKVSK